MYGSEDQAKKRFSVLSSTINDRSTEQPLSRWGNSSRQVDWLKEESHTLKVWECQKTDIRIIQVRSQLIFSKNTHVYISLFSYLPTQ
ncbi:hypothetical protein CEN40_21640 [Fischerella thermalis CCMEE 5205]|nr:hypothetical protein CEN40_21640 [Fischerella thermalis CCMEE 5205]